VLPDLARVLGQETYNFSVHMLRTTRRELLCGLIGLAGAACRRSMPPVAVGVASARQRVLGELIAQTLERRLGAPVNRNLDLGGSLLAHDALVNGRVDLYPEGAGWALLVILQRPPDPRPEVVLERVRLEYRQRFRLEWMDPLGFSDGFVMVVSRAQARSLGLRNLTDAARLEEGWRLASTADFFSRDDGMAALTKGYSLRLRTGPLTVQPEGLFEALRQARATMIACRASDPELLSDEFVALEDDRHAFPPDPVAIVVRAEALTVRRGLREALTWLSGRLPLATVRELYRQVRQGRPAEVVASEFLRTQG